MSIMVFQLKAGLSAVQLFTGTFYPPFPGTDWSVCGTNTDPGQLGGGEVSL